MRKKHNKILQNIFFDPILSNIVWKDIEKMLETMGANIEEAAGSRTTIELNDIVAVFHRPHPRKETDKGAVKSMRRFLIEAGVEL